MYRPPLKEISFALHSLARDEQLEGLPSVAEYSRAFADAVIGEAGTFAQDILDPLNSIGDREGARWTPDGVAMPESFKAAFKKFAESGWTQLRAAAEFGGLHAPTALGTAIEEIWASANMAFQLCPMLTQGAIEAIERCGNESQKRRYLPSLIAGDWTGTMNLTEPQAGSDLAAIRTRAVPDGSRYRIFGQKIFITYGDHDLTSNIVHLVLARIEGAPPGVRGISLFIVPKRLVDDEGRLLASNDVRCVSIEHKLGIHASPTCVMSYGDAGGAIGELVGEPNRGLEYMFIMMNAARLAVGLQGYALGERAYQRALDWARARVQGRAQSSQAEEGSTSIVHHPDVKRMLLTMRATTEAARALALYAAVQLDLGRWLLDARQAAHHQQRGELLIPIVKGWSTETGITTTSLGVQIHGGMGFIEETGAAQYLRDARITTIYEGTTGIQASDLIGRKIARDRGAAMLALLAEASIEITALRNAGNSRLTRTCDRVAQAIEMLQQATQRVVELHAQNRERALAVSTPYLMLSGVVLGGWLMVRAHGMAVGRLNEDREFFEAKIQTASFYVSHVLTEAHGLARTVVADGADVALADVSLF